MIVLITYRMSIYVQLFYLLTDMSHEFCKVPMYIFVSKVEKQSAKRANS